MSNDKCPKCGGSNTWKAAAKEIIRSALDTLENYYDESTGKIDGHRMMSEISTLKRQRDMLLDALKPIVEYPGIREYIGSILADKAQATIAAVEGEK